MNREVRRVLEEDAYTPLDGSSMNLYELVRSQAGRHPDRPAILSPGEPPLLYRALIEQIESTISALRSLGIERNDRVAIVLPNGPEMATSFLGVACCATSAPLNPAYRASELEFYLSDLGAKALLIQSDMVSPARAVAEQLGIRVIELSPCIEMGAGRFSLRDSPANRFARFEATNLSDIALVLHTSGTTSHPKIVPLTQSNLCASARNIRTTFSLTPDDRCLNVMPLFHIHGLIGALLSSLSAGSSVVCTSGFYAPHFFDWLREFAPTWYTAVPTMHQAILDRVEPNRQTIAECRLRFIRSASSALPPTVMSRLEREFGVPVVEAYGMTEATHQVASNPLPPGKAKAGSVGVAVGVRVAIMDEAGSLLPPLSEGQIVISGATVLSAYENNPPANESSFVDGWFKTGDQGYIDEDSYVFITGRLKELINRGGEKIAPLEIDRVLLDHPAIDQAVAFAIPDPRLGEDVAAAVVLRKGSRASELDILEFAARKLADFKVPRKLLVLEEIPKGPTGKIQRVALAERLGLVRVDDGSPNGGAAADGFIAPRTFVERVVAGLWSELLEVEQVGMNDDFLVLGGDSVIAARLVNRLNDTFNVEIPLFSLFRTPTVAGISEYIEQLVEPDSQELEHRFV